MHQRSTCYVDLHTHTWYSADSSMSPAVLVRRARAAGLNRVAVTDHGTISGALEAQALDAELIIIGEEVRCAGGVELIGLFLTERIANGLSAQITAQRIREQGGIVYAPHPFAYLHHISRTTDELLRVADIVEVFNSRAFYPPWNRQAQRRALELGLRMATSSDAHMPWELGRAYSEVPAFETAGELLEAMWQAEQRIRTRATPLIHALSIGLSMLRHMAGRGHGTPLMSAVARPATGRASHGSVAASSTCTPG